MSFSEREEKSEYMSVARLFKIACLQKHILYKTLSDTYPLHKDIQNYKLMIFISIPSIISSWTDMIKASDSIGTFTPEYVTAAIIDMVGHYRGHFPSANIYLYTGSDAYRVTPSHEEVITRALREYLPDLMKYIPKAYYVADRSIPSATLIGDTLLDYISKNPKETIETLFITSNKQDYVATMVQNNNIMHSAYITNPMVKRIYVGREILNRLILRAHRAKYLQQSCFDTIPYDRLMTIGFLANYIDDKRFANAYPKIIEEARAELKTFSKNPNDCPIDANNILELLEDIDDENMRFKIDLWSSRKYFQDRLDLNRIQWCVDSVDYSFEKLNDTIFKNIPLNTTKLFRVGV